MSKQDVSIGDKVIVGYEGVVTEVWPSGTVYVKGFGRIAPSQDEFTVEVVEKAKRQWKVGDVVAGQDYAADIPHGTVVGTGPAGDQLVRAYRDEPQWVSTFGATHEARGLRAARTIRYIPES